MRAGSFDVESIIEILDCQARRSKPLAERYRLHVPLGSGDLAEFEDTSVIPQLFPSINQVFASAATQV